MHSLSKYGRPQTTCLALIYEAAMQITDTQVAALRAFLLRDPDKAMQLTMQLGNEGIGGYQRLAGAALSIAAGRHFSPQFTSGDLVRFVASVRISRNADGDDYDFNALTGENVLRRALGENTPVAAGPEEIFRATIALLDALTDALLPGETHVDSLLGRARQLAASWLEAAGQFPGDKGRNCVRSEPITATVGNIYWSEGLLLGEGLSRSLFVTRSLCVFLDRRCSQSHRSTSQRPRTWVPQLV